MKVNLQQTAYQACIKNYWRKVQTIIKDSLL